MHCVHACMWVYARVRSTLGTGRCDLLRDSSNLLQKLLRMRAALSLSLSSVVGQKASLPSLLDNRFTGAPSLSTNPYILSKPALLLVLVLCQNVGDVWAAGIVAAVHAHSDEGGGLREEAEGWERGEEGGVGRKRPVT